MNLPLAEMLLSTNKLGQEGSTGVIFLSSLLQWLCTLLLKQESCSSWCLFVCEVLSYLGTLA